MDYCERRQLRRWRAGASSTGKWAEKDMDVALDLGAGRRRLSLPLSGLVDQLMKKVNQEKMKALLVD